MGRAGRGNRGPGAAPLQAQRQEYAELRARGVSNAEACRIVGVNRRTGTRWLYGRNIPVATGGEVHYPPVINYQQAVRSERFLSEDERELIAERLRVGDSLRAIGRALGRAHPPSAARSPGTVIRPACTAPLAHSAWPPRDCTARARGVWAPTPSCVMPSRACSIRRGVPSRSAMCSANASRTSQLASSALRASTRRSMTATAC